VVRKEISDAKTDVATEGEKASQDAWFPTTNANARRAQHVEATKAARPEDRGRKIDAAQVD
jgi:hypothetical protein